MKATEILMQEHRVIERVLDALDVAVGRVEHGGDIHPSFFLDATDFIRGFADGCHHQKEEGVLFKTMAAAGIPEGTGPLAVMLAEHEQARAYTRGLREAAQRLQAGDQRALAEVIRNTRGYVRLLREHILKEDAVLFPMANSVIPAREHANVLAEFGRIEHEETGEGVHQKYLALAGQLESQMR